MLGSTAAVDSPLTDVDVLHTLESREREADVVELPMGTSDVNSVSALKAAFERKRARLVRPVDYDTAVYGNDLESVGAFNKNGNEIDADGAQAPLMSSPPFAPAGHSPASWLASAEPSITIEPTFSSSHPGASHSQVPAEHNETVASISPHGGAPTGHYSPNEESQIGHEPTRRFRKKMPVAPQPDLTAGQSFFSSDMWDLQTGSNLPMTQESTFADVPTVRRRSFGDAQQPAAVDDGDGFVERSPLRGVIKTKPKKRSLSGVSQPDLIGLGSWAPPLAGDSTRRVDAKGKRPVETMRPNEQIRIPIPEGSPHSENFDNSKLLSPVTESILPECEENEGESNESRVQWNGSIPDFGEISPIDSIQSTHPYEANLENTAKGVPNPSLRADEAGANIRESAANRHLVDIQEASQSHPTADSAHEVTSSLHVSNLLNDDPSYAIDESPLPTFSRSQLRVVNADIQPQTVHSETRGIPLNEDTSTEEHYATYGEPFDGKPNGISSTQQSKHANMSMDEDHAVVQSDLKYISLNEETWMEEHGARFEARIDGESSDISSVRPSKNVSMSIGEDQVIAEGDLKIISPSEDALSEDHDENHISSALSSKNASMPTGAGQGVMKSDLEHSLLSEVVTSTEKHEASYKTQIDVEPSGLSSTQPSRNTSMSTHEGQGFSKGISSSEDESTEEHAASHGAQIDGIPNGVWSARPSKNASMPVTENQEVTDSDLTALMVHPVAFEVSTSDDAFVGKPATSRAGVQDKNLSKEDEDDRQFDEPSRDHIFETSHFNAKPDVPEVAAHIGSYMLAKTTDEIPRTNVYFPSPIIQDDINEVDPVAKPASRSQEYKRQGAVLTVDEEPAEAVTTNNQVTDELAVLAQIEALNKMLMSDSKAPNSNLVAQEPDNTNTGNPAGEQFDFWNQLSAHGENLAKREPDMFAARIEMGVPSASRGKVWMILTEAKSQNLINKYDGLWKNARLHYESTIIRDVENRSNGRGDTSALRRLMSAYFALDSRLGYCFNLQHVAHLFLDNMSEADSLCTMSSVMKSSGLYRLREWYCGEGLEVALYQFRKLMEEHLPELASHLSSRKVAVGDFSIEWFTSLFTKQAPGAFAVRILDLYLLEGPKFIFKVAVVVLRSLERSLMLCASRGEIMDVFNGTLLQSFDVPDQLIQQALAFSGISESKLEQYEVECKIRTWRTRQSMDNSTVVMESGPDEKEIKKARPISATSSEAPAAPSVTSPSPTPASSSSSSSSMIPSGLYSLFARASRRRSEASAKFASQEASSNNSASGTHSRTGSASSAISTTKPVPFGHPSASGTAKRASDDTRDASSLTMSPFSKFSPPNFSPEFAVKSVLKDHESLLRKSETERARLDAALSTSAAKNVNLANDLLVAQNALVRERGSNSLLRKEMNSLQIQLAESEIRASMFEAELKLLQSRMDQTEVESRRMKVRWDRLMAALLDD